MTTSVSKNADRIAGMFDAIARRYDLLNRTLSAGIDRGWRRRAIESLQLTPSDCLLDLCTGTADLAITASGCSPAPRRVVGVDFAHEMLRIGRAKVERAGLVPRVALVRCDAMRLGLRDGSVDAVTIGFGIRNVEDPAVVCRELHRVLRSGGRVAILEFSVPSAAWFRAVYMLYFRYIVPRLGRLISGHAFAYEYLPASVDMFAKPDEFVKILRHAGFARIQAVPLTFGAVFLYTGYKDARIPNP